MIQHRGPDGQDIWVSPSGRVGLAHAHLNIIDLTSIQPIENEDGKIRIVVNGEFYNHRAIRNRLEAKGHRFRTNTDSEVALHLYEEYGVDCLTELRGEFAFVIWDERDQTIFAARDRFGIKPLFFSQMGTSLYLASEAKALFAAGVPASWDHQSVFQNLHGCFQWNRSLFDGVFQIQPGHFLLGKNGRIKLRKYWEINYPSHRERVTGKSEADILAEVRSLLDESVSYRMQADVPVGCLLSGGIDSSTLLAVASKYNKDNVTAFTIAFDHNRFDEQDEAREAVTHVGAEHHVLNLTEDQIADNLAQSAWHGEMIQYNAHGTARFLLSKAIQTAGYRSVIAGEGADELFAGYAFLQPSLPTPVTKISSRKTMQFLLRLLQPFDEQQKVIAATSPWLARITKIVDLPSTQQAGIVAGFQILQSVFDKDLFSYLTNRDPFHHFLRNFPNKRHLFGRERAKQIIYIWLRSAFVNYHLAADRLDMAHGVEVRLPYLDHKLFEYLAQIPTSLLAKGSQTKYLLREVARPVISESMYKRVKKPFIAPPSTLRPKGRLHEHIQDTLRSTSFQTQPFFNQTGVIQLLDRLPKMGEKTHLAVDPLLMSMASLSSLHSKFGL